MRTSVALLMVILIAVSLIYPARLLSSALYALTTTSNARPQPTPAASPGAALAYPGAEPTPSSSDSSAGPWRLSWYLSIVPSLALAASWWLSRRTVAQVAQSGLRTIGLVGLGWPVAGFAFAVAMRRAGTADGMEILMVLFFMVPVGVVIAVLGFGLRAIVARRARRAQQPGP